MTKPKEVKNNGIDDKKIRKLCDSAWQEGLSWRKRMLETIAELRCDGVSDNEIFRELKKAGLTNHTANRLMDDAEFFNESFDKSPEEYAREINKLRKDKK